jgi:hypothetical protein
MGQFHINNIIFRNFDIVKKFRNIWEYIICKKAILKIN